MKPPQTFLPHQPNPAGSTAAQIADAARLSKRAVLKALASIPPTSSIVRHGNETALWTFDLLTPGIQESIALHAAANSLSVADYLAAFMKPWKPALPLEQIDDACLDAARKLRSALLPVLQRMDSVQFTPADRIRLGLADFKRAFGHEISERHWQRLRDRTLWRDGGKTDFHRLEIYLPNKLKAKPLAARRLAPHENQFAPVQEIIKACADAGNPTNREKAAIWLEAFELYDAAAGSRREKKQRRRALVKFLSRHAPALAANEHALRVSWDRKHARWLNAQKSALALLDGREAKRGIPTAKPFPQTDIDKLTWHAAANCGGRVAQAVREFTDHGEQGGLSADTLQTVTRTHTRKSQVNRRLASRLRQEVDGIMPFFLGKKAIDDATAHVDRDYSKLAAMQVVCADDFTFPVYFYVPDGNGWFTLTRGQCLLMLDIRSWRVIGYSLQPERNYNSLVIRTLMNRICSDWGIPGNWYFERGIWKNSLLVKGNPPAGWLNALSWPETEIGWEKFGVKFVHATRARSKPIERVGGLLQDLMHGVRGYCGRDERRDCPEVTRLAIQDVQRGRVDHPGELFFSFQEWDEQLGQLVDRYNAASQDGKVLQGLSPDEAFEQFWPHDNPPARMDENCWHLVAHYVRPIQVTVNGICFRIGGKKFVYRNTRTGEDRGKTLLAWLDPGNPEFLCVTDMNKRNPYLVERATEVDFLAAPGDPVLSRELAKAASHGSYPRARFHTLKARFAPTFRRNIVDIETAETAQEIQRQRTEKVTEQRQISTERNRASANFRRLGMALPARLRPGQAEAARGLSQLLQKDEDPL